MIEVNGIQREPSAVRISETTIDAQEKHSPEWPLGRVDHAEDLVSGEFPGALPGSVDTENLLAGPFELRTETHRCRDHSGLVGEPEGAADHLNQHRRLGPFALDNLALSLAKSSG
jgi:hypothetical protein